MQRIARALGFGYLALCLLLALSTFLGATSFSAPMPLFRPPAGEPFTITLAYSSEKEEWLKAAVARFEATSPTIDGRPFNIELVQRSSLRIGDEILTGSLQPTLISPASAMELARLDAQWRAQKGGDIIAGGLDDSPPLFYSPIVLIAWTEVANRELQGISNSNFWQTIHDALLAQNNSEYLALGQTRPTTSNSGLATLLLMASDRSGANVLTLAESKRDVVRTWIGEMERNVSRWGDSTDDLVQQMVTTGPSQFEAVFAYENLAIQYATRANRWGEMRVFYPPTNLWADHPLAILNAEWVSDEQREAAQLLREFLMADESQRLALERGFRPGNPNVSINADDSPFRRFNELGIDVDGVRSQLPPPEPEVVEDLRQWWQTEIGR